MITDKTTAREVLRDVVDFLNNAPCDEARDLWNILTALRGPDDDNRSLKYATTSNLRGFIGLKGVHNSLGAAVFNGPLISPRVVRDTFKNVSEHFLAHYRRALRASNNIGLYTGVPNSELHLFPNPVLSLDVVPQ